MGYHSKTNNECLGLLNRLSLSFNSVARVMIRSDILRNKESDRKAGDEGFVDWNESLKPTIFLTCRTVYREAVPILYSTDKFSFRATPALPSPSRDDDLMFWDERVIDGEERKVGTKIQVITRLKSTRSQVQDRLQSYLFLILTPTQLAARSPYTRVWSYTSTRSLGKKDPQGARPPRSTRSSSVRYHYLHIFFFRYFR